jgi:lysozyme
MTIKEPEDDVQGGFRPHSSLNPTPFDSGAAMTALRHDEETAIKTVEAGTKRCDIHIEIEFNLKGDLMIDAVVDVSHHNGQALNFATAAAGGIAAVIHKATQGRSSIDPMFAVNRAAIGTAGLSFGAYHFGDGSDGGEQAKFFLDTFNPGAGELLALDFEANPSGPSMTLEEARAFVTTIHDSIGKWPVLYSGHFLKEALGRHADAVLSNCPLWLAQYGPTAVLPTGWSTWSLWQYSDGTLRNPPPVPGIGHCDRNCFVGNSPAELQTFWTSVAP